jgi:hypothetical protein
MASKSYDFEAILSETVLQRQVPKLFVIESPAGVETFEKACNEVADRVFYARWRATIKVGGKAFEEIRAKNPQNEDILLMTTVMQKYRQNLQGGGKIKAEAAKKEQVSDAFDFLAAEAWSEFGDKRAEQKKEKKGVLEEERKKGIAEKEKEMQAKIHALHEQAENMRKQAIAQGISEENAKDIATIHVNDKTIEIKRAFFQETTALLTQTPVPEEIDIRKPAVEFSKVGVISAEVSEVLGITHYEEQHNFLVEKFWSFDKKDFESETLFRAENVFGGGWYPL